MKTWIKPVFLGLFLLLVLGFAGLWIWSATGTYASGELAAEALQSSAAVRVSQDAWILMEPSVGADIGLVFYPGGLVEPSAYAPILRQLAEAGYLVVITPMPFNLAIFNTDEAQAVLAEFPEISAWVIAGHSLGGAAASIHSENAPDDFLGLALWDSFPASYADLSDNSLAVISIFGTHNGAPNPEGFDDTRGLLPPDTHFVGIEGANHAQFGDYGPQSGDLTATISAAEQQRIVTELMLDFFASLR